MVCRINYREQFGPVVGYAFKHGKEPEIMASSLCGITPREITAEFETVAGKNTRCKAPVAHFVLSPARGEILSRQQWERICQATAAEFRAQQWVAVLHRDTECQHISFILSRIRLDGKAWPTSNDRYRLRTICRAFEDVEGLHRTREHSSAPRVGKEELEKAARLQREGKAATPIPDRLAIAVAVQAAHRQSATLEEFQETLRRQQITTRWRHDEAGRPVGVSFARGEAAVSGRNAGVTCRMLTVSYSEQGTSTHEQVRKFEIPGGTASVARAAHSKNIGTDPVGPTGTNEGTRGNPQAVEGPCRNPGQFSGDDSPQLREVGDLVTRAVCGLQVMTQDLEEDAKRFTNDRHLRAKRQQNRKNFSR